MRPPHMVDPQTLRQQRVEAVGVAWQRNGHIVAHEVIADQRASRNKGAARWEHPAAIGLEIRAGRIAPDQSYQNYVVPDFVTERCRHRHATLSYPLSRSLRFFFSIQGMPCINRTTIPREQSTRPEEVQSLPEATAFHAVEVARAAKKRQPQIRWLQTEDTGRIGCWGAN